jgi:hypothetical protein
MHTTQSKFILDLVCQPRVPGQSSQWPGGRTRLLGASAHHSDGEGRYGVLPKTGVVSLNKEET